MIVHRSEGWLLFFVQIKGVMGLADFKLETKNY